MVSPTFCAVKANASENRQSQDLITLEVFVRAYANA